MTRFEIIITVATMIILFGVNTISLIGITNNLAALRVAYERDSQLMQAGCE